MKKSRKRKTKNKLLLAILLGAVVCIGGIFSVIKFSCQKPEEILKEYMAYIEKGEYEQMYELTDRAENSEQDRERFINRNSRIYEGLEVKKLKVKEISADKKWGKEVSVSYVTSFDSVAGKIEFENQASLIKRWDGYKIVWTDQLIFPNLTEKDKIRVSLSEAQRGQILDRNGKTLAGKGIASWVGIVPGKLKDNSVNELSRLLEIEEQVINKKLEAEWVKEDSFVPITMVRKIQETDLMKIETDEEILKEQERQSRMLEIPGVMLSDTEVRFYPLGAAASHLIGYVQPVTAEDLENHPDEGYHSNSVIGRTGMEGLFEKELKGRDGCEINIVDENGRVKETIAQILKEDGKDIRLTIDSKLQKTLYQQFQEDTGCSAALNPYTGEILALVSTPSYDNNDFIKGITTEKWNLLNEDKKRPLYNRFRQVWCPGSSFKPVVAGIGLKTGIIDPNEDFGNEGLSWQKDSSWGSYYVTTLHECDPVTMKNALIYSDNIYFAKAALRIGAETFSRSLDELGFNQEIPFEIQMSESQYSNTEQIETEIQLADSGYGQGQILVNPIHLASIYTAFLNGGNMVKPYLVYRENPRGEIWIPKAFPESGVSEILEGLKGVISDPNGTGRSAYTEGIELAGKTGTAELKASKEDTEGTEIGWFSVFTAEKNTENPILLISMVENVKDLGGSSYVVKKDKEVLDQFLAK